MAALAGGRLSVQEAAARIGKASRTTNELIHKGKLAGFRDGGRLYTTEAAVAAYLGEDRPADVRTLEQAVAAQLAEGERELAELRAALAHLPKPLQGYLVQQFIRKAQYVATIAAMLAGAFLWTQQVADSAEQLVPQAIRLVT